VASDPAVLQTIPPCQSFQQRLLLLLLLLLLFITFLRRIYYHTPATNHIATVYRVICLLIAVGFPPGGSGRYNCTQLCAWGETIGNHGTHKVADKTRKTRKQTKQKIKKHKTVNWNITSGKGHKANSNQTTTRHAVQYSNCITARPS
jgi:hypothetical protein